MLSDARRCVCCKIGAVKRYDIIVYLGNAGRFPREHEGSVAESEKVMHRAKIYKAAKTW
jgi:hypothetical protein